MTSRNGRHMLHIKNLQTEDFGNYRYVLVHTHHKSNPSSQQLLFPGLLFVYHLMMVATTVNVEHTEESVHPTSSVGL